MEEERTLLWDVFWLMEWNAGRGGLTMENSYEVEGILCKSSVPYSDQQLVN